MERGWAMPMDAASIREEKKRDSWLRSRPDWPIAQGTKWRANKWTPSRVGDERSPRRTTERGAAADSAGGWRELLLRRGNEFSGQYPAVIQANHQHDDGGHQK